MTGTAYTMKRCCNTAFEKDEGTLNATTKTITFNKYMSEVTIINEDVTNDLKFKFLAAQNYGTLKAKETITISIETQTVLIMSTSSINYRIWAVG